MSYQREITSASITGDISKRYISDNSTSTEDKVDCSNMFDYCTNMSSVSGLSHLKNVISTFCMFVHCASLVSVDVSDLDTSQVTNMESMFRNCVSLTSLDLSSFDTSQVVTMKTMFNHCISLTSLDLSSFDTSKVTVMLSMFSDCASLTSLDLSSFDTSTVVSADNMFSGCSSLTNIVFGSDFDLSSYVAEYGGLDNARVGIVDSTFPIIKKSTTVISDDADFMALLTSERAGTWVRIASEPPVFCSIDADGGEVKFKFTWSFTGSESSAAVRIYCKASTDAFYPSNPTYTTSLSGASGTYEYIVSGFSEDAQEFRIEVEAIDTYVFFINIASSNLIEIDQNGNIIENGHSFYAKSTNLNRDSTNPSAAVYGNSCYYFCDKDGETIGLIRVVEEASGRMSLQLSAFNETEENAEVYNLFQVMVDKEGSQQYAVSNSGNFRSAIGAVSKSGDTMTGTLIENGHYYYAKNTNLDRDGSDPTETTYGNSRIYFCDKDEEVIGIVRMAEESNGRMSLQLAALRENSSNEEISNWFNIRIAKDGTRSYSVTDAAAFRSAISAQVKPSVLYNSSTGTTGTVSLSVSAANYNHMRIYFGMKGSNNTWQAYSSVDVYSPNGKKVAISVITPPSSNTFYVYEGLANISGTSITRSGGYGWVMNDDCGMAQNYNYIYIVRVEGWNE